MENLVNFSSLNLSGILPTIVNFADGEFKLALQDLQDFKTYYILVQTDIKPTKNIFATSMLVDIVNLKSPTKIVVIHPWLSFSRQDNRFMQSEPLTINILLDFYLSLGVTDLVSCDIHSVQYRKPGIYQYIKHNRKLNIHNINIISSLYSVSAKKLEDYEVVSPTGVDEPFLLPLREKNIPITYFKKEKWCSNCDKGLQYCFCSDKSIPVYKIISNTDFAQKNILIVDDIIAGGGTMLSTVIEMKKAGVKDIKIMSTHGFFNSKETADEIISSCSETIISNTVHIPDYVKEKITVIDVSNILETYVKEHFEKENSSI